MPTIPSVPKTVAEVSITPKLIIICSNSGIWSLYPMITSVTCSRHLHIPLFVEIRASKIISAILFPPSSINTLYAIPNYEQLLAVFSLSFSFNLLFYFFSSATNVFKFLTLFFCLSRSDSCELMVPVDRNRLSMLLIDYMLGFESICSMMVCYSWDIRLSFYLIFY